jgi:hypothetical protein
MGSKKSKIFLSGNPTRFILLCFESFVFLRRLQTPESLNYTASQGMPLFVMSSGISSILEHRGQATPTKEA